MLLLRNIDVVCCFASVSQQHLYTGEHTFSEGLFFLFKYPIKAELFKKKKIRPYLFTNTIPDFFFSFLDVFVCENAQHYDQQYTSNYEEFYVVCILSWFSTKFRAVEAWLLTTLSAEVVIALGDGRATGTCTV